MSIRDQIIAASDIASEKVFVKEWNVTLEVRSMTAADRARLVEAATVDGEVLLSRIYPDMVILSTYDPETGERVFDDNDRDVVMAKNAAAVEAVATVVSRLSGFESKAVDAAGKGS